MCNLALNQQTFSAGPGIAAVAGSVAAAELSVDAAGGGSVQGCGSAEELVEDGREAVYTASLSLSKLLGFIHTVHNCMSPQKWAGLIEVRMRETMQLLLSLAKYQ